MASPQEIKDTVKPETKAKLPKHQCDEEKEMAEDDWVEDAHPHIDEGLIGRLQQIIRDESAVIVEHKHYRGSRAPDRIVFDDPDALSRYFAENVRSGDLVYVWKFETVCTDDRMHTYAKMPNAAGRVPVKGSY